MAQEPNNLIYRFFARADVSIAATLVGVFGVLFGVYSHFANQTYRDLSFAVHPVKATVVKTPEPRRASVMVDGQPTPASIVVDRSAGKDGDDVTVPAMLRQLRVFYNGKEVDSDVTLARVALWNAGRLPIKPPNILRPIEICFPSRHPILDVRVAKLSREVIDLELDTERCGEGVLGVTWRILEHGDGASLQITYAGDGTDEIAIRGVVEGQRAISMYEHTVKVESPEDKFRSVTGSNKIAFVVLGGLILLVGALHVVPTRVRWLRWAWLKNREAVTATMVVLAAFLVLGIFGSFYTSERLPPFGF